MKNSIKNWCEEDRPREKLLLKGADSLSETELIAILIGVGGKEESAVDLARKILKYADNNLPKLARLTPIELSKNIKGIGPAKAVTIVAALELGRRHNSKFSADRSEPINSSRQAAAVLSPILADLRHEEFWLVYLNNSNKIIGKSRLSLGGISATVVDVRIVMKQAILNNATGLIAYHNHPGGVCQPSEGDILTTKKIRKAAEVFDIRFLDHIIICGHDKYYSFSDEGML